MIKQLSSKIISKAALTLFVLTFLLFNIFVITQVSAESTVSLSVYRNNGYAAFGDINGLFTITAQTSDDVIRVEFYLDDTLQLNDTQSPFSWYFDTNNYTLGQHTITAVAFDASGQQVSGCATRKFC